MPLFLRHKADVIMDLFADDSSLSTRSKDLHTVEHLLQDSLTDVSDWCHKNKMKLNSKKSKSMVISTRQKHQLQPLILTLRIGSDLNEQVKFHRVLGVIVDEKLTWHFHIDSILKTVSRNLFLLSKLWHYASIDALKAFFYAHCLPHINYASTIWCNTDDEHVKMINRMHKRAVKLMCRDSSLSTEQKYKELDILTLKDQFTYNACILVFKQARDLVPEYLRVLLPSQNTTVVSA